MPSITSRRIESFCRSLLEEAEATIEFVDVGSGGELKAPWKHLPRTLLNVADFEPTNSEGNSAPICVSDKAGPASFYVAHDERASSLRKPLLDFVQRFSFESMLTKHMTTVSCVSLDEHFYGRYDSIDAMDINVEGHDFQVLQGARELLAAGTVKLMKIEFELTAVYEGQGYFSDIDAFLRERHFRLAHIQVDNVRPSKARHLYHPGESIWGKALYAPQRGRLATRPNGASEAVTIGALPRETAVAVSLYVAAELPGFALDIIEEAEASGTISPSKGSALRKDIEQAFRWAKLEEGYRRMGALVSSAKGGLLR